MERERPPRRPIHVLQAETMKIALAIYNFDPKKGGAERYTYDLALNLSQRGHDVFVFCNRGIDVPGITRIPVPVSPYPRWLRTLSFALNHKKLLKSFSFHIILGFGNTLELDVFQSHGGVQKIWMEREIASYDNPGERRYKAMLLRASLNQRIQQWIGEHPIRRSRFKRIVAISDMVKTHMMEYYGLDETRFDIVYNGVDTARFRPGTAQDRGGTMKILFSAGNFRLKGLSPLLRAMGSIDGARDTMRLVVMGRGKRERYLPLVKTLGLGDSVTFLGESSSPERAYADAHILAHPTFYDACSLTTMEAMSAGLPVITTRWNGASALVSANEGFVIDEPRNIAALAAAIQALRDTAVRKEMGRRSRQKLETYTIGQNASMMENIFREVCHER